MGVPYSIILADPPWQYNARRNPKTRFGGGAMAHYPTMKTKDICALPVKDVAAVNALLYLWATGPKPADALEVMKAWGFTFATVAFVWVKLSKAGKPLVLPGNYTGSNAEFVFVGRRGKQLKPDRRLLSQIVFDVPGRHSAKPEEVRRRIDAMHTDTSLRRVELFARDHAPGWDVWGNEVEPCPLFAQER